MPSWRRSDTSFAAPRARPSSRATSLAMVALPSVAGSSLVNPQVVSASMKAVAELLSCCVLGLVAAKRGILSPANVGALSQVKPARKKYARYPQSLSVALYLVPATGMVSITEHGLLGSMSVGLAFFQGRKQQRTMSRGGVGRRSCACFLFSVDIPVERATSAQRACAACFYQSRHWLWHRSV